MRPPSTAATSERIALPMVARGATSQAIGPSRGGHTTKIHALTDVLGQPGVLLLTPGNASDVTAAPAVLAEAPGRIRRLSADKGYDADWLRADLRKNGITPIIPGKRGRKREIRRQAALSGTLAHRGDLQPPQGLPPHCHAIRQARPQLRLSGRSGRRHRLLVLIESKP